MFAVLAILSIMFFVSCSDSDKQIDSSELPASAQTFIAQYFPNQTILYAERDASLALTHGCRWLRPSGANPLVLHRLYEAK